MLEVQFHNIIQYVGRFHDSRICQLYYMGLLNKLRIFIYYSSIYSSWTLKFVWSYIPSTMRMNYCSSKKFEVDTISSQCFSCNDDNTSIENTNTIHNNLTTQSNIIHYSYWHQFLLIFEVPPHKSKIVKAHVRCYI